MNISRTAGKGRITGAQLRVGDVLTEYGGVTVVEILEDQHIANGPGGEKVMGRRIRTSPPWNPPNDWMSAAPGAPYIVADTSRRKDKTVDPEPDPNSPFWFSCPVCDKQLKGKRSTEVVPRHNHKLSPGKPCEGVGKTWAEASEFRARQLAEWQQRQRWSSTGDRPRVRMSAMQPTASTYEDPPPIADGFVVVKVDSHRATDKLNRLVGPSLSYGRWNSEGIYHVIPEAKLDEAAAIKGVTHVKRPETHTDHHFHWGQDQSLPGLLPRTSTTKVALTSAPPAPIFDADGTQIGDMPWIKVDRISREGLAARYATTTSPCPNCGEQVSFTRSFGSEAEQARYEDIAPWTCAGCGSSGTEEDLARTASAEAGISFEEDLGTIQAWANGVCMAIIDGRSFNVTFIDGLQVRHNKRLADAKRAVQDRISRPSYLRLLTEAEDSVGPVWPRRQGSIQTKALGEQKAPPEVDTLRDEACPVCGETDAYSGDDCAVCGFVKPPDMFTDPDIDKAKEVNLRQDQQDQEDAGLTPEGDPAPASGLEQFRVDGPAAAGAATSTGQGLERFKVGAKTASGRVEIVIDYGKCYMTQPDVAEKLLRGLEAFRRSADSTDRKVWTVPQMMWDDWHIATNPEDAEEIVSALGELGVNSRFVKVKQAKVAGFGDESEWMEGGDDRVYLVDTDNRPIIYGDDASATPASFLWPRAEAQAAIGTAYVKDPGYGLPAAQIMDPQHYVVTWADRHGQSAWWLMSREHQANTRTYTFRRTP